MAALAREQVRPAIRAGLSARATVATPPRFKVGERVVARTMHPTGHTRLPRYVRGKRGIVQRHHGGFVFPDTRAHGHGDQPQHLYNVRFEARELWGEDAAEHDGIYLDLWESYLAIEGAS